MQMCFRVYVPMGEDNRLSGVKLRPVVVSADWQAPTLGATTHLQHKD